MSSTPARQNFLIKTNTHWSRTWQILNSGVAFDITGYDFELELRTTKGSSATPAYLTLSVGDGITIVDEALGKIKVEIEPQTAILTKTDYYYDLIAIASGKPYTWLEGKITFDPGVSFMNP